MDEEHDQNADEKVHREPKKRMKRFYNSIRQQIEFYLGDVNLTRDRFFSNLLQESPYIDVEVILKCNKIKKLTTEAKDIVQALEKSTILSVTEDGKKIFRTVPVEPISNADDCTIYVEDLPLEVDHEWLKSVFSNYGKVVYVSIPRYKTSHKLKGFAFIQFDSVEGAERALEAFRSADSCLFNTMEPQELLTVKTFEGKKDYVIRTRSEFDADQLKCVVSTEESDSRTEDEESSTKKSETRTEDQESSTKKNDTRTEDQESLTKKRKRKNTRQAESEPATVAKTSPEPIPKKKSKKTDEETEPSENEQAGNEASELISKEKDAESAEISEELPEETKSQSHKRKRKKVKKNQQVQTFGMQILSKNDWKKLRNKYLEEQRKRMGELKYQLQLSRKRYDMEEDDASSVAPSEESENPTEMRIQFIPGVIVKVQLDKPIKGVKRFKEEVKRYADVEYIDASEDSYTAYFRCASNEIANQVIGLNKWPNMIILAGDEERAYWEKIKNDRKDKYNLKIRCVVRGKNKLLKKAEAVGARTHIRFLD